GLVAAASWVFLMLSTGIFAELNAANSVGAVVIALLTGTFAQVIGQRNIARTLREARAVINDPLAAYIYTGRCDGLGEIELAQHAIKSRLRTALGRFGESSRELLEKVEAAHHQARKTYEGMTNQQQETAGVANAMQQMAIAVQEV